MTVSLTGAMMLARWPRAPHSLTDGLVTTSVVAFAKFGILTPVEAADFMAQISEETGNGVEIEENLNYSSYRLCQVWPSRFPTLASAQAYAMNPRALANNVYGSRYGNRPGTDDGYNFRGRGGIQITFHDWYAKIGAATGLDLLNHPEIVNDPVHFLECSAAYWKLACLNNLADAGDFRGETVRANGGLVNYPARLAQRQLWRPMFGLPPN